MSQWRDEEQDAVDAAIAEFPKEFSVRAFRDKRFTISRSQSFVSQGRVQLYVFIVHNDGTSEAFAKASVDELRREIITA